MKTGTQNSMYALVVRDNSDIYDRPYLVEQGEDKETLQNKAWEYEELADNFERYSVMLLEHYYEDKYCEYFNIEDWEYEQYKHVWEYDLEHLEDLRTKEKFRRYKQ